VTITGQKHSESANLRIGRSTGPKYNAALHVYRNSKNVSEKFLYPCRDPDHDRLLITCCYTLLPKIHQNVSTIFRVDALALSVIATATWLAGWVAVRHSRYCIKTTKPIWKLFGPSGSPII